MPRGRSVPTRVLRAIGGLAAGAAIAAAAPAGASEGPRTEEVAPGVFALLQPAAERFDESNSMAVVREGGLLVVDTQSGLAATRATIAAIRARSELPVRYLVLTHWHGDHVQGVAAYREVWPGIEVIGHRELAAAVRGRAEPYLAEQIERARGKKRDRHLVSPSPLFREMRCLSLFFPCDRFPR